MPTALVTALVADAVAGTELPSWPAAAVTDDATELSAQATSVATGADRLVPVPGGDGAEPPDPEDPVEDEEGGAPTYVAAPLTATCPPAAPRAPDVDDVTNAEEWWPPPPDSAGVAPAGPGFSVDGAPEVGLFPLPPCDRPPPR